MQRKIIFAITKSNWGGAQRYVYDLACALPRDTTEPMVACGGSGELAAKLRDANIPVITIPNLERNISFLKEVASVFSLWRIFLREAPHAVHLNSSKIGGLGALAARLAFVPNIIFTAHGWAFHEDRSVPAKTIIWILSWCTALFAHRVIILTNRDMRSARRFPLISKKKFIFLPNGIDERDIPFLNRADARTALGLALPEGATLIGAITEFTPNKGVAYLLSALEAVPADVHAVLIGGGEEEAAMKKRAETGTLAHRIHFAGFRPDAARLLKAFDIFVFPSLKEGLPFAILEAGLAGLPIVASDTGGIPDIIEDGKNGFLVKPKDSAGLASKILLLTRDADTRDRFSNAIYRTIRDRFSKQTMIRKTFEIYRL